jgi:transposase
VVQQVAARAKAARRQIPDTLQARPVVHGEETGWREQGQHGDVGTFPPPTPRYFGRAGRPKARVDAARGATWAGVLVGDFEASDDPYPGRTPRCWAPRWRALHDLREVSPPDAPLAAGAQTVHALAEAAQAVADPDEAKRAAPQRNLEERLRCVGQPFLAAPLAAQGQLGRRIARHGSELVVLVATPLVPTTNQAAARRRRHLVTSRKIRGGTQSPAGTRATMTLASLFATWRLQNLNPLVAGQDFLKSPAR